MSGNLPRTTASIVRLMKLVASRSRVRQVAGTGLPGIRVRLRRKAELGAARAESMRGAVDNSPEQIMHVLS